MDENAKTELHLSEEQLQQAAGGCRDCTGNINEAFTHLMQSQIARRNSTDWANIGFQDRALHASLTADFHLGRAREIYHNEIVPRQAMPGHDIAPDAPPPNAAPPDAPPAKRRRF